MRKFQKRTSEVVGVVVELVWRGFGLFLFILGGAAGTGSIVAGDWWVGIQIAWGTLMLGVLGALGYAIATTGSASKETVAKASQDAVQKAQDKK